MPWAFGPILSAGVALGAAAVVVANPIVVPRADVQIAVSDLPTAVTGDGQRGAAIAMLDEDFIEAVGPGPAPSTHPLAVLTDLVRVLVADAAYLGKNAVLHAFTTGARVIAEPVLTSTSYPYVPAVPAPYGPAPYVPVVPADVAALPWLTPTPPPVTDAGDLGPVVAQALTAILSDVADVSGVRAVAAAFAAGAALATEHLPVVGAVVEAVQQDLGQIIGNPISVLAVMPRTRESIGDGIRTVVGSLPLIGPIALWEPPSALDPPPTSSATVPNSPSTPDADSGAATPAEGPSPSGVVNPAADTVEAPAAALTERRVRGTVERQAGADSELGESVADTTVVDQPAGPEPAADLPAAVSAHADSADADADRPVRQRAPRAAGEGRAAGR